MSTNLYAARDKLAATIPSRQTIRPVQVWAMVGAILLALEFYFTIKWVAGDQFVAVQSGPDLPPEWMRMALDIGQVVMVLVWSFSFYWFVLRPWLRERRFSTDGCLSED